MAIKISGDSSIDCNECSHIQNLSYDSTEDEKLPECVRRGADLIIIK